MSSDKHLFLIGSVEILNSDLLWYVEKQVSDDTGME